ncbi:MAG: DUF7500 family protein, partial [Halobacteriota archaeon]
SNDRNDRTVLSPDELDLSEREEVAEIDEGRYVVSPSGSKPRVDPEALEKQDWLQREDDDEGERTRSQPPRASQPDPPASAARSAQPADPPSNQHPEPKPEPTSDSEPDQSPDPTSGPSSTSRSGRSAGSSATSPPQHPDSAIDAEDVSKWLARSFAKNRGTYGFDLTVDMEGNVKRTRAASNDIGNALESMLMWYADQATDDLPPEEVIGILLASTDIEVKYPVQSVYEMCKRYKLKPDDSIGDLLKAVRKDGTMTVPPSRKR